jgi:dihydroflavonol-4-reductase
MILVIGATGFIGTNVVRELVERGESVRIFRRTSSNMLGLENLPFEEYFGDLLNPEAVRRAMKGCTRVFHLAAVVSLRPYETRHLSDIHIKGTNIVAQTALEEGVERFVYTSSGVTVGYNPGSKPATEANGVSLTHLGLPYVETKIKAEELVLQFFHKGLPAVIVNPGYTFGPWDKSPKLNQLLIMAAQGKLNFYFTGGLSVVNVADVAHGHLLAMDHGRLGERYILSNQNLTYQDFFTLLNAYVGRKPPKYRLPYPVMFTVGFFAETYGRIFRLNPQLSTGLARLYKINHYLSSEKAMQELHYTPRPLEDSLDKTFRWLREHNYIT